MAGLGDYSKKTKGNRGYKMKGPSLLKMVSALKQKEHTVPVDPDAPGTPGEPGYEPEVKSMDYLTKIPVGPRAKDVKPSQKEIDDSYEYGGYSERYDLPSELIDHEMKMKKGKNKGFTKTLKDLTPAEKMRLDKPIGKKK